jgi:transmembrane 9 superfamily protein 2/4
MTSSKTLLPIDYYRLPFCAPLDGPKMDNENLGEFLAGDRIESSPYYLLMKKDMYCEQLCISNMGRGFQRGTAPNKAIRAIRKNYHNNWIVDNLSAASKVEDDARPFPWNQRPNLSHSMHGRLINFTLDPRPNEPWYSECS